MERDPSEAFNLLIRNVEVRESWLAYLYLARLYEKGIGVQAHQVKMAEYYRRDSELLTWQRPYYRGYYGLCLIRGMGVPENKKSGWKLIQQSIQGNNVTEWYAKGECYRFGFSVEPDVLKAVRCYKQAEQVESGMDGKVKTKFALGCIYESGKGGLSQNLQIAMNISALHLIECIKRHNGRLGSFVSQASGQIVPKKGLCINFD